MYELMRKLVNFCRLRKKVLLLYALLLTFGWLIGGQLRESAILEFHPSSGSLLHPMLINLIFLFVFTAAIPFVPGAEIGFGLLLMFGASIAPLVYGSMVCALALSFLCARLLPCRWIEKALYGLGFKSAGQFVCDINERPINERHDFLERAARGRLTGTLLRNKYLTLAALINLPGNSVIGGGGGIAFISALSGAFRFWEFFLVVAVAVAPVPLLFALM